MSIICAPANARYDPMVLTKLYAVVSQEWQIYAPTLPGHNGRPWMGRMSLKFLVAECDSYEEAEMLLRELSQVANRFGLAVRNVIDWHDPSFYYLTDAWQAGSKKLQYTAIH